MRRRRLGRSSLEVPVVSFGAWAIGGWYWGGSDDDAAIGAVRAGIDAGMDAIDTAPVYGFGRSERVVGRALKGLRDRAIVMTKAGLRWDDPRGPVFFESEDDQGRKLTVRRNARPDSLRHEVEQSLTRLAIDAIDLLQIHWPDPETPLADSLGALVELRREGKIRELGVSNFTPAMLDEARLALGDVPLASTQERFSALSRGLEAEVLPWTRRTDVGVLAYSPLEQGLLSARMDPSRELAPKDARNRKGQFDPANRARIQARLQQVVGPIARARSATIAQVVIAATVAQPGITSALVGARDARQAVENAAAGKLELAPDDVARVWNGLADFRFEGQGWLRRILGKVGRR